MKDFIKSMLGDGETSVKRVIAFLGFLFIAITMFVNSFFPETIKPSTDLVDAVKLIVIICIGGNVAEKFMDKK